MENTLITNRLILRKVKKEDAEPMFYNWASDPEVTKYLTWPPHQSVEVTKSIIEAWIKEDENPQINRFMITTKESGEPIGSIDVVGYVDGAPEVGYCLARNYWNKGYMTEAFKALIDYLFNLGFTKIVIEADTQNIGSNKVIEKCGFAFTHQEYKEHRSSFKLEPVTVNWYQLTKSK